MNESNAVGGGRRPLAVFAVVDRDNRPSIWIRIGSAFTNRDGSMNLVLDAFPIGSNRLHVREQRFEETGRNGHPAAPAPDEEVNP